MCVNGGGGGFGGGGMGGAGHEMTLSKREYLRKWYGFDCMCSHCKAYLQRYNLPAGGDGGAFFH